MKNKRTPNKIFFGQKIRSISLHQMKQWIASDVADAERFWKTARPMQSSKAKS